MYIARVKLVLKSECMHYERDLWEVLFHYGDIECRWRYNKNNTIEFLLGLYKDRFIALEEGKRLYAKILYRFFGDGISFEAGCDSYVTRMYHEDQGYTVDDFIANEEYFFWTPNYTGNYPGLAVYQIDNSFDDYDKYYGHFIEVKICTLLNDKLPISDLQLGELIYTPYYQHVFALLSIANKYKDEKIAIPILCRAIEYMACDERRSPEEIEALNSCIRIIQASTLTVQQKQRICSFLESGKNESSRQKCINIIKQYCKPKYNEFTAKAVFDDSYSLRSAIVHGMKYDLARYPGHMYLRYLVLEILRGKMKEDGASWPP